MQVADVILMFCMLTNPIPECRSKITACVEGKQAAQVREYVANESKKGSSPDKMLLMPPQGEWPTWLLECAKEGKKNGR